MTWQVCDRSRIKKEMGHLRSQCDALAKRLATAEEEKGTALHRQLIELTGSAEERLKLQQQQARDARIELIAKQVRANHTRRAPTPLCLQRPTTKARGRVALDLTPLCSQAFACVAVVRELVAMLGHAAHHVTHGRQRLDRMARFLGDTCRCALVACPRQGPPLHTSPRRRLRLVGVVRASRGAVHFLHHEPPRATRVGTDLLSTCTHWHLSRGVVCRYAAERARRKELARIEHEAKSLDAQLRSARFEVGQLQVRRSLPQMGIVNRA